MRSIGFSPFQFRTDNMKCKQKPMMRKKTAKKQQNADGNKRETVLILIKRDETVPRTAVLSLNDSSLLSVSVSLFHCQR